MHWSYLNKKKYVCGGIGEARRRVILEFQAQKPRNSLVTEAAAGLKVFSIFQMGCGPHSLGPSAES